MECPPSDSIKAGYGSLAKLSVSDAKKAGFTVLKKTGKGEYERQ